MIILLGKHQFTISSVDDAPSTTQNSFTGMTYIFDDCYYALHFVSLPVLPLCKYHITYDIHHIHTLSQLALGRIRDSAKVDSTAKRFYHWWRTPRRLSAISRSTRATTTARESNSVRGKIHFIGCIFFVVTCVLLVFYDRNLVWYWFTVYCIIFARSLQSAIIPTSDSPLRLHQHSDWKTWPWSWAPTSTRTHPCWSAPISSWTAPAAVGAVAAPLRPPAGLRWPMGAIVSS